ncbi:MAG: Ig-like domain-containing protein [Candidatus Moraniibacteriota bacterium]
MAKRIFAIFVAILISFPYQALSVSAASDHVWDTRSDFSGGTSNNVSFSRSGGDLTLEDLPGSVSDTSEEDFNKGSTSSSGKISETAVVNQDGGEVSLGRGWTYSLASTPAISDNSVRHSFFDSGMHALFVATSSGLSVIDTKGTVDPADDTLVTTYTTTSTPAIAHNYVLQSVVDPSTHFLYVSTDRGLSVIDTKGTITAADDTLVMTYKTSSTPAIADNYVYQVVIDPVQNLLYVGTNNGLSIIDTKGTVDPADDTLVTTYTTSSTPAIADNCILHTDYVSSTHLLYTGTCSGLSVIDTKGTLDPVDDTLVITYSQTSTPVALAVDGVKDSFFDPSTGLLYIGTEGGGLSVVDTKGTVTAADDTLVTTYSTSSSPSIAEDYVYQSVIDPSTHFLYVATDSGLSVIDTKGTVDPADDTLVTTYLTSSSPSIASNDVYAVSLDASAHLLYVSAYGGGFSVISLEGYVFDAYYRGVVRKITDIPTKIVSFDRTQDASQTTTLSYRTAKKEAPGIGEPTETFAVGGFQSGGVAQGWRGDERTWLYNLPFPFTLYGQTYNSVRVGENGMISFGHGSANDFENKSISFSGEPFIAPLHADLQTDVNPGDDIYITVSVHEVRFRWQAVEYDTNNPVNFEAVLGDDSSVTFTYGDQTTPFAYVAPAVVGIGKGDGENYAASAYNGRTKFDRLDSSLWKDTISWDPWSTPCVDNISCVIDQSALVGRLSLQYRLDLTTGDPKATPTVNSVTYSDGFVSSGTYVSDDLSFPDTNDLLSFQAVTDISDGTAIAFEYSIDQGISWSPIDRTFSFPSDFKAKNFEWRATLTSTDPTKTPVIRSVTLTSTQSDLNAFDNQTKALDMEGNTVSFTVNNIVSNARPELSATNPKARNGSVTIYTKTDNGGTKRVRETGLDADGHWKMTLPGEKEGKRDYTLRYTDQAGNRTGMSKPFTVFRDLSDPIFMKALPASRTLIHAGRIDFPAMDALSGIHSYAVRIFDQRGRIVRGWKRSHDPFYVVPASLPSGAYRFEIESADRGGNTAIQSVSVKVR